MIRLLGLVLSLLALEEAPDVNRREDIGLDLFTSDEAADISISDETGASILPAINQQIISCEALLAELKGYLLRERSGADQSMHYLCNQSQSIVNSNLHLLFMCLSSSQPAISFILII